MKDENIDYIILSDIGICNSCKQQRNLDPIDGLCIECNLKGV